MDLKKTFEKGVMNKDLDERLVPNGYFKHAENIITDSTNGSDLGVIKNILSNKKITNINLGENVRILNGFSDETRQKIYYFVLSNLGSFLIEYDDTNQTATYVLKDTRINKVLDLKDDFRITSVQKIYNDDSKKDLLLWTNNDMEICCINIDRAKTYGENGFDKEDIFLIKKPPIKAPDISFIQSNSESNEIEEKFVLFAYRYKYLDGEYSARSPFTYYNFIPKPFEMDFETLQNKGMVNNFNAVNVFFNTGDKRVTDIQILAKFSNSETIYIVETLNKIKEGYNDDATESILYNNKKLYAALPEKEIYRTFDNVPRKAKALTLIGNRVVLGNYTEGYDIIDNNGEKIKLSYDINIKSKSVSKIKELKGTISQYGFLQSKFLINSQILLSGQNVGNSSNIFIPGLNNKNNSNIHVIFDENTITPGFKKDSSIEFYVCIANTNNIVIYQKLYSLTLNNAISDYNISSSAEVVTFIEQINKDIEQNFVDSSVPDGVDIQQYPYISLESGSSYISFILNPLMYEATQSIQYIEYKFHSNTFLKNNDVGLPTSLKSFCDYEIGIVYQDEFKRSSNVLTSINNTKFIPFINCYDQNKLQVSINHKAPYWAKYYQFAIKTKPLQYENIYVNRFYVEDGFTWAKLEGDNKDKVKKNDILLVKKTANNNITKPIKIKVLDIQEKESDFIKGNKDDAGLDIIEEAGLYMKIKPTEFSMDLSDFIVKQTKATANVSGSGNFPTLLADLFTSTQNNVTTPLKIPSGSVIQLYIKSSHKPDAGWQDNVLNKTYYVSTEYSSIGEWFKQNIENVNNLYGNEGNSLDNYHGKIQTVITNNKEYLRVTGTKAGMTGGRSGYLDVSINVRTSDGFYVFETVPTKEVDLDIYYLDSEVFEIKNGFHLGNEKNQTNNQSAVSTINFFNCYTFGNGVESYKIRDGFNENYLNIDYSPCTTTIEEFKETTRLSDITWSSVYNESTNINGLNEFNNAANNWKELDKQNGEIRLLNAREGNLLVIQEDKWGQILYGKNAIYSADGSATLTTTNDVLRDYVPYAGTYGITDIESFVTEANRCYAVDKKRGTILRLSMDGLNEITNGMNHWFKTTLQDRNKANIIAGYDPYYKTYNITIDEQPEIIPVLQCGQSINKYNLVKPLKYKLVLNGLIGDLVLNYNVSLGIVNIKTTGSEILHFNNISGQGTLNIPISTIQSDLLVEITPVTSSANIELTNNCPLGNPLKFRTIVLSSLNDTGLVFTHGYYITSSVLTNGFSNTNNFSFGSNVIYQSNIKLLSNGISQDSTITGQEGIRNLPAKNNIVGISLQPNDTSTFEFNPSKGHKVKYLITSQNYTQQEFQLLVSNSNQIDITNNEGSFVFDRDNTNENIYLIYDLRGFEPLDIVPSITLNSTTGLIKFEDIFDTDFTIDSVVIPQQPSNAIIEVVNLNSFSVIYNGANSLNDTIVLNYEITIQETKFQKSLTININVPE